MSSKQHFDHIAKEYDYWKKKNWYYHQNLKILFKSIIPDQSRIWEIGCGTGDILASLQPSQGLGTDISSEMIEIAKKKYAHYDNLTFRAHDIIKNPLKESYNYVVLADVLEHVENLEDFFAALRSCLLPETRVIISIANPIWEPILMTAEKFNMKMPEGPHWRLSLSQNEQIFQKNHFSIQEKGYRLLVPKKIWGSDWINRNFYKNPITSRFGFVHYWVLKCI